MGELCTGAAVIVVCSFSDASAALLDDVVTAELVSTAGNEGATECKLAVGTLMEVIMVV